LAGRTVTAAAEIATPAERIRDILGSLIKQRQGMRAAAAEPGLIEANRLAIVYWQRQLSLTLLAERRGTAVPAHP
jgi:hypothetical protein